MVDEGLDVGDVLKVDGPNKVPASLAGTVGVEDEDVVGANDALDAFGDGDEEYDSAKGLAASSSIGAGDDWDVDSDIWIPVEGVEM